MRISDWSSDVCSSDLLVAPACHDRLQPQIEHVVADLVFANRLTDLRKVRLLAPQFELGTHAQQHCLFLDTGSTAWTGRQGDPPIAIEFQMGCGTAQLA